MIPSSEIRYESNVTCTDNVYETVGVREGVAASMRNTEMFFLQSLFFSKLLY